MTPSPSPFLGTRWFDFVDRDIFFGREVEKDQIAGRLLSNRPVFVYGPSGAGKSSILLAGVIPEVMSQMARFHAGRSVIVVSNREWRQGGALDAARWHVLRPGDATPEDLLKLPTGFTTFQEVVEYVVARAGAVGPDEVIKPLVVFILDQLEDIWPRPNEDTDAFADLRASLAALVLRARLGPASERLNGSASPVAEFPASAELAVAAGIRHDTLGLLDKLNDDIPLSFDDLYELPLLNVESAREAIREPLKASGYSMDDGRVHDLLTDLQQLSVRDAVVDRSVAGEGMHASTPSTANRPTRLDEQAAIEPILLQIVMTDLVRMAADQAEREIRYPAGAGSTIRVRDIAALYFSKRIEAVDKSLWRVRDLCFSSLVSSQARSIAKDVDELHQDMLDRGEQVRKEDIESIVKTLARERIFRPIASVQKDGVSDRYELFHNLFAVLARYRSEQLIVSDRKLARRKNGMALLTLGASLFLSLVSIVVTVWIFDAQARKAKEGEEAAKKQTALARTLTEKVSSELDKMKYEVAQYAPIAIRPKPSEYTARQDNVRQLASPRASIERFEQAVTARQADVGFLFAPVAATDTLFSIEAVPRGRPKGAKERNCSFRLTFDPAKWPRENGSLGASYSMISWGWDSRGYERPPVFSTNIPSASKVTDDNFVAPTCHRNVYAVIQPTAPGTRSALFKLDFCGMARISAQPGKTECRVDGR